MKRSSLRLITMMLIAVLLISCIGCSSGAVQSDISVSDNRSDTTSSDTYSTISTQGNDKVTAQREYFKNNPVEDIYSFDVKLRNGKTTRILKVLSNGVRITEVTISPLDGKRAGSPIGIVSFADVHFNAVNDKDKDNPAIKALYEGRDFNKGNVQNTEAVIRSLEFGKLFDRTIILGDVMDYFSFGSMELLKSVITDKYDVLMTLGNHEAAEIMPNINGVGYAEKYTLKEKYDYLNKNVWPNDVYLYREILSNKENNEKAMVILLDNSTYKYLFDDSQYKQLESYIAEARQKQLPVLIFQHCPISTGWGDKKGNELVQPYDIVTNPNGIDFNFGKTGVLSGGSANGDAMTDKVYKLITSNGDIIKGIFCGHNHNNIYTEVLATTPDGANAKIPQYTVSGNYNYSNVIQITVL